MLNALCGILTEPSQLTLCAEKSYHSSCETANLRKAGLQGWLLAGILELGFGKCFHHSQVRVLTVPKLYVQITWFMLSACCLPGIWSFGMCWPVCAYVTRPK